MEAHGDAEPGPAGPRQCTGAATVLDRMGQPNTVMQLASRLGEPDWERAPASVVAWVDLDAWADQ